MADMTAEATAGAIGSRPAQLSQLGKEGTDAKLRLIAWHLRSALCRRN